MLLNRLLSLLHCLCLVLFAAPAAGQEDAPPYIYYYSDVVDALVIERADGSDSRTMAANINSRQSGRGVSWSPSGDWLVVGDTVVSVDDQYHLSLSTNTINTTWLPSAEHNLLFYVEQREGYGARQTFGLFNLDLLRTAQIDITLAEHYFYSVSGLQWNIENLSVSFCVTEVTDIEERQFVHSRITLDSIGYETRTILPFPAPQPLPEVEGCERRASDNVDYDFIDVMISPKGEYSLTTIGLPILTDLQTGQTRVFYAHSAASAYRQIVDWFPNSDWFSIVFDGAVSDGPLFGPTVVTNASGTVWREIGSCRGGCVRWLPAHIQMNRLPPGQPQSVLPAPLSYNYDVEYQVSNLLTNVSVECSIQNRTIKLQRLDYTDIFYTLQTPDLRCPYQRSGYAVIDPTRTLITVIYEYGSDVDIWRLSTGEHLETLNVFGVGVEFSDDGQYLYTRSRRALLTWSVADILERAAIGRET